MNFRIIAANLCLLSCLTGLPDRVVAQTISQKELIFLTSQWTGERYPDGRPKIADDIIERARKIGIEEAWTVLRNEGYHNQFAGGWKMVHESVAIVGRAVTAQFMPSRPDLESNIKERGKREGRVGDTNVWPIATLTKGDVYVADGCGKIAQGTLVGATLGSAIFKRTGTGVIFDASARDLKSLETIPGFNAYVRDFHPSFLEGIVLTGLNTPIRIGTAIVLPGDLVLSEREGVLFIPAHLAELVVRTAEFIGYRDQFGYEMLKQGRYQPGQIDSQWTDAIKDEFLKWLKQGEGNPPMTRAQLDQLMSKRTW